MQNIIPLDWIDVTHMAATLLLRHDVHFEDDRRRQETPGSPHHDTRSIFLRVPEGDLSKELWFKDVPHADTPLLGEWPSARRVIEKIAESHFNRAKLVPVFGKIMVVSLHAGGWVDWHIDQGPYAEAYDRFHIGLVPSPGAFLFSGPQGHILGQGELVYLNNRIPHSAINGGQIARVNLIFDIRRPEEAIERAHLH